MWDVFDSAEAAGQRLTGSSPIRVASWSLVGLDKETLAKLAGAEHGRDRRFLSAAKAEAPIQTAEASMDENGCRCAVTAWQTRLESRHIRAPCAYCDGFLSLLRPLRLAARAQQRHAVGVNRSLQSQRCFHEARRGKLQPPARGGDRRLSRHPARQVPRCRRFADMEVFVEIQENVRGEDVFVIQSTSFPANDHLMELLIIIDALRRASARRITAVIPYFGYARQDRKPGRPHADLGQARRQPHHPCRRRPRADARSACRPDPGLLRHPDRQPLRRAGLGPRHQGALDGGNRMVVSPDVGGVVRARALAKRIDAQLAIVDKRRERPGESEVMNIIGDVEGRSCILVDDIVDSGGTLCNAAEALLANGAKEVSAYITHGVLSGGAVVAHRQFASSRSSSSPTRSCRPRP